MMNYVINKLPESPCSSNTVTTCRDISPVHKTEGGGHKRSVVEVQREGERKKRKMDHCTSTPVHNYRTQGIAMTDSPQSPEISPIKIFNMTRSTMEEELNLHVSQEVAEGQVTNLSQEVKRLLITPKSEDESLELLRVLKQTLELTRAAYERGIIKRSVSDPDTVPPEINHLMQPRTCMT